MGFEAGTLGTKHSTAAYSCVALGVVIKFFFWFLILSVAGTQTQDLTAAPSTLLLSHTRSLWAVLPVDFV